jgi:hypothetical protein
MKKIVLFGGMLLAGSVLADTVLLSDTFSTNATRTAGTVLNGNALEVGGVSWAANNNAIFVGSGEYAWSSNESNFQYARAALPSLTGVEALEWQVDARVYGTQADNGVPKAYLALGRSDFNANVQEGLRLTLQNSGSWAFGFHNGSSLSTIATGNVSGDGEFAGFFFNTLKLRYDFESDTVSGWINNNQIITDYDMTGKSVSFGAAGWVTQNNVSGQVRYDNFSVAAVPEPAALGLLVGAGSLLLFIRRHFCM